MKKHHATILPLGILLAGASLLEANLDVSFVADGDGRFTDYFSAAYAQIDLEPDGMYSLADDSLFGASDVFPTEGTWSNVGQLNLSAPVTGVGVENFTITGGTFDFDAFVVGALASPFGSYSTTLGSLTGSVETTNGVVTTLLMNADIGFVFAADPSVSFDGQLTMTESAFDLTVDETETVNPIFGPFPARQAWEFSGSSVSVVPEPSAFGSLVGLGFLFVALGRPRRKHSI